MAGNLSIVEHFYTIQGEGFWTGTAAYFIRLGGCDVGCFWCDVKESWDAAAHPQLSVNELVTFVKQTPAQRVVITGGEPSMHNLNVLTATLQAAGLKTHIETSGTGTLTGAFDWVCLSPKKFKAATPPFYEVANELKIIVQNAHDLEWAETQAALCPETTQLFLQPEWSRAESAGWIVEYVKRNPRWRISLQTHKFIEVQ